MNMTKRMLGKDLKVSAVGLGCMGMTHASGAPADTEEMTMLLAKAVDMGYTLFDTAECYTGVNSDGSTAYNEELVGPALKPYRSEVVIATKYGVRHKGNHLEFDSRPETIRKSIDGSLKKLGTDYIDLYYQHRIDPKVSPEEVAETMASLMKEGKILHWGISEADETYLRRAHAVCPVTAIQNRLSMMYREYESLFPVLEELQIGFVAFSPLANGFLTARYRDTSQFATDGSDFRSRMPQFTTHGVAQNEALLHLIETMAQEKNATPAQISLAWMLNKKPYIVPIPGSRKPERIQENIGAADIMLTTQEVEQIDIALNSIPMSEVFGGHSGR
jgi:aryl-alcohol dehydrogenase-like predicted oxidoreductase